MKSKDNTFSVKQAEDSFGLLLWQVTNFWQREIKRCLEQYDITQTQFALLARLFWMTLHNEEITQIALSNYSKIDAATTSSVLRTLQRKGLIRRQEHATDTRAKTIDLTERGMALIKKAVVTVEQKDKEFFSSLEENAGTFNKCLNTLATRINQE